jgi:hypothetical protein
MSFREVSYFITKTIILYKPKKNLSIIQLINKIKWKIKEFKSKNTLFFKDLLIIQLRNKLVHHWLILKLLEKFLGKFYSIPKRKSLFKHWIQFQLNIKSLLKLNK